MIAERNRLYTISDIRAGDVTDGLSGEFHLKNIQATVSQRVIRRADGAIRHRRQTSDGGA